MQDGRAREGRVGHRGAATATVGEDEVLPVEPTPSPTPAPAEAPRWRRRLRSRQLLAWLLGVAVLAAPIVAATAVVLLVARLVEPPHGAAAVAWWIAVSAASWVVAYLVDRGVRRHLPLIGLYRLALVLPADVPSRLGVALRAGTIRDLEREVIDLRDDPTEEPVDDRTTAAARVVTLAAALQRHDRFTRGHSERVRAYTDLLAAELELPDADREQLRWAALLHDIGKTGVSPALLNKPAELDHDEWLEMRSHPAHGAHLAEPLRAWLGEWVDAVGQHHERFDGSGYPNGHAGEGISLAGRIVAVADAYETMTARRPYKRPMPHEAARQELVAQAGAHFDPQVVRAMLNLSVRRLRWAAGPLSLLGDVLAARLIVSVGSAGRVVDTIVRVAPTTGAAAAVATAGVVAVAPLEEPPTVPVSPMVQVADVRADDLPARSPTARAAAGGSAGRGAFGRSTAASTVPAVVGGATGDEGGADVAADDRDGSPAPGASGSAPGRSVADRARAGGVTPARRAAPASVPRARAAPALPATPAVPARAATPPTTPGERAIPATPATPAVRATPPVPAPPAAPAPERATDGPAGASPQAGARSSATP